MYHGQGTCEFREGHTFKGELRYGLLHGKGEFMWVDATRYKGEFRDNEITGTGRYDWPDASYYEGQVLNGLRHGRGVYTHPKEGVVYEGEWRNGLRHGTGVLKYRNGSVYEGKWERGMKWGQGKMTYASANYYEGEWKHNKRNGEGTMHWLSSNEKYSGNWEDNYQSGFGTHIWLEGSGDNKLLRNRYVGYWRLGLRHGQGTFYYSNGSKYEGEWRENLKNGFGVFTFEDGTTYQGPFENDRMVNRTLAGVTAISAQQQTTEDGRSQAIEEKKASDKTSKAPTQNTKPSSGASPDKNRQSVGQPSKQQAGMGQTVTSTMNATAAANATQNTKFLAANRAKKEVEQNPFKTLIDISDLIEFEQNPVEVEKEVQNILLRNNSEMKSWYKYYAKKVESQKSEESFALTLRQIWRFLRDCQIVGPDATLASFDRVYFQGKKNHFTLLGQKDKNKFNYMQPSKGDDLIKGEDLATGHELSNRGKPKQPQPLDKLDAGIDDNSVIKKAEEGSDFSDLDEEEEEDAESLKKMFKAVVEAEDLHQSQKVVLQRQFFEAIVRAASVKYANKAELPTLAEKLDSLFKSKLSPNATKNKAKSLEEEKQFKIAEKVFEEYETQLKQVFAFFSKRGKSSSFGVEDITLEVDDLINMFKKTELLTSGNTSDTKPRPLQLSDLISSVEKYYSPEMRLESKLTQEQFQSFVKQQLALKAKEEQRKAQQTGSQNTSQVQEASHHETEHEDEEHRRKREEEELQQQHDKWRKQVISHHLVFVRGVEIVFFEFKEILLDLALKLRDFIDPKTGKIKVVLTKFIEEILLRNLNPYLKFNIQPGKGGSGAVRVWPESQKDREIKVKLEEKRKREDEERRKVEEKQRQERELARMQEEDAPALDWKQVEELRRKMQEEEEARRRAAEAEEEDEEEDEEEGDEEGGHGEDDDY